MVIGFNKKIFKILLDCQIIITIIISSNFRIIIKNLIIIIMEINIMVNNFKSNKGIKIINNHNINHIVNNKISKI